MDRFKFRVWDNEDQIFLTKARIYQNGECYCAFKGEWNKNRLSKVEMCTGLKDKNGKLIYEGDIFIDSEDIISTVSYCNKSLSFVVNGYDYKSEDGSPYGEDFYQSGEFEEQLQFYDIDDCKIIGNIHENTEILK